MLICCESTAHRLLRTPKYSCVHAWCQIQTTALKSNWFSPLTATCYFTASEKRLRQLLHPKNPSHFVSSGNINPEKPWYCRRMLEVSLKNACNEPLYNFGPFWAEEQLGDLVTLSDSGTQPTAPLIWVVSSLKVMLPQQDHKTFQVPISGK